MIRLLLFFVLGLTLSAGRVGAAHAREKVPHIGFLSQCSRSYDKEAFEKGLRDLGYVDKILKGAKPSDLPIEQVSEMDLIIDLRVAREMGIRVPDELLYRAEQVIR